MSRGRLPPPVHALLAARPPLLVVTDFDGTLAPIVAEPDAARILPSGRLAVRALARVAARRPGRVAVAVLSGRRAADVAARVRAGGVVYLGSHGMERGTLRRGGWPEAMPVALAPAIAALEPVMADLGEGVRRALGDAPWLFVEPKGPSVGFHYRAATDPTAARTALLRALDAAEADLAAAGTIRPGDLVRLESRRVVEVRPAAGAGKGDALLELVAETGAGGVLVVGDDRTDIEAFRALRRLAPPAHPDRAASVVGVAVGVHGGAETPPDLVEASDLLVDGPVGAARLLGALARELEAEGRDL